MSIEEYVDHNAWWWRRSIWKGAWLDYTWHRENEDKIPEPILVDAMRFMHERLGNDAPSGMPHKDLMRETIIRYSKTEYFKPREKWEDVIQAGEEPVPGVKLTIV